MFKRHLLSAISTLMCDHGRWFSSRVVLGTVHTRVEVCRMDLEMNRLVERPWLQLMCCAICLLRGCNLR